MPRASTIMTATCTALMKRATAPYFSALVRPYSSAAEFHARSKNPMRTMMRYDWRSPALFCRRLVRCQ